MSIYAIRRESDGRYWDSALVRESALDWQSNLSTYNIYFSIELAWWDYGKVEMLARPLRVVEFELIERGVIEPEKEK